MASAPPLPTEFHRVVVVLDGARLKGKTRRKRAESYYVYLRELKRLVRRHGAALEPTREIHLKRSVIRKRKRQIMKLLKGRSR